MTVVLCARRLAWSVLLVLAVSMLTVGSARASSIFFIRDSNIWVANPDGSDATQVTSDGSGSGEPYIAVAAAQNATNPLLVFHQAYDAYNAQDIYGTINPDGTGKTTNPFDTGRNMWEGFLPVSASVAIDNAGDRIAWSYRYGNGEFEPDSVGVNGSSELHIEPGIMGGEDVAFGDPGGASLLFDAARGDESWPATCSGSYIGLVRQDPGPSTSPIAYYCAANVDLSDPAISPTGTTIAAVAVAEPGPPYPPGRIVTIPLGGGASASAASPLNYLTPAGTETSQPDFSPDGTMIAFDAPGNTIDVVRTSGGTPVQILTDAADPAWSPYTLPSSNNGAGGSGGGGEGSGRGGSVGTSSAKVTVSHAVAAGTKASVHLLCAATPGQRCTLSLVLSVMETKQGGKIVAIDARAKRAKRHRTLVILGRASVTLAAGHGRTVQISLNRRGKAMLAKYRTMKVNLSVSQAGQVVFNSTIRFREPKKHKH